MGTVSANTKTVSTLVPNPDFGMAYLGMERSLREFAQFGIMEIRFNKLTDRWEISLCDDEGGVSVNGDSILEAWSLLPDAVRFWASGLDSPAPSPLS